MLNTLYIPVNDDEGYNGDKSCLFRRVKMDYEQKLPKLKTSLIHILDF